MEWRGQRGKGFAQVWKRNVARVPCPCPVQSSVLASRRRPPVTFHHVTRTPDEQAAVPFLWITSSENSREHMGYLRFLLLGNTLAASIWSQDICCDRCWRSDVFVYSTSLRSASSPAVSNSMTQTQTQTPHWLRRAGDYGKSASFSPRT